jgi:hypothetical protein
VQAGYRRARVHYNALRLCSALLSQVNKLEHSRDNSSSAKCKQNHHPDPAAHLCEAPLKRHERHSALRAKCSVLLLCDLCQNSLAPDPFLLQQSFRNLRVYIHKLGKHASVLKALMHNEKERGRVRSTVSENSELAS